MNKRKIALGPGAASLILIVVVLSLCMLAMLAQIGSRNDFSLASRSADMITRVYELSDQSERRMAELDAILVRCRKEAAALPLAVWISGKSGWSISAGTSGSCCRSPSCFPGPFGRI